MENISLSRNKGQLWMATTRSQFRQSHLAMWHQRFVCTVNFFVKNNTVGPWKKVHQSWILLYMYAEMTTKNGIRTWNNVRYNRESCLTKFSINRVYYIICGVTCVFVTAVRLFVYLQEMKRSTMYLETSQIWPLITRRSWNETSDRITGQFLPYVE